MSARPLTICTAVGHVALGGLNSGHDFSQVSETRAGKGQDLGNMRDGEGGPQFCFFFVLGNGRDAEEGSVGRDRRALVLGQRTDFRTLQSPGEVTPGLQTQGARWVSVGPAATMRTHVCAATLLQIRGPPVPEHLLNNVAPGPAPKHRLPVLVPHILRETKEGSEKAQEVWRWTGQARNPWR